MSTNIGGYIPGFRFRLNVQNSTPKIISGSGANNITGSILDTVTITTNYSNAITGSQYQVQIVPEQYSLFGQAPTITLSSSNTGIATIDSNGNTTFNNTGNFNIIGTYNSTSYYAGQTVTYPLVNTISSISTPSITTYTPLPINVNQVLIIYNTNSTNSLNLKNYYTGHRPLFSGANILGISCPSGQEIISYSGFTGLIRQPIINYLTGISGSTFIRYAVMMCDIPTRVGDTNINSVPYQLYQAYQQLGLRNGTDYTNQPGHFSLGQYQQVTLLTSYINFATYHDCTSYIDKISAGQTGLYLTGNSLNTGYLIEDYGGYSQAPTYFHDRNYTPLTGQFPSVHAYYNTGNAHIVSGGNLAGYCSWGNDGGLGSYATDGLIKWTGNNNWYLILTVDSFNGRAGYGFGSFWDWFSSGAFGGLNGTGYNNCPVGAVGTCEEPFLNNSNISGYFNLWQSGFPLIECAWQSRHSPYMVCFGDPLIVHG